MTPGQFDRLDVQEFNRRLEAMATRVATLSENIAVIGERDKKMAEDISELKTAIGEMKDTFAKGRGAIFILTLAASILATTIALWDKVPKPWGH